MSDNASYVDLRPSWLRLSNGLIGIGASTDRQGPLLASRPVAFAPSPFQAQGEISPGKNVFLRRTTAGSM